ncbi:MAG: hypothetical protein PHR96_03675 [Clostridia bacterium]|nr:hypothetical protein [Clostridia bacterium]
MVEIRRVPVNQSRILHHHQEMTLQTKMLQVSHQEMILQTEMLRVSHREMILQTEMLRVSHQEMKEILRQVRTIRTGTMLSQLVLALIPAGVAIQEKALQTNPAEIKTG